MFSKLVILFLFGSALAMADVNIKSYHTNEWRPDWSLAIKNSLSDEMLDRFLDEDDLESLNCPDYNYASKEEKIDFWTVFFASLARSESGLNEKAKSPRQRGHRSYGLLQLAPDTALNQCNLVFLDEEILNGADNLSCGVKLMSWQLNGANGKRTDLTNQLFGKRILLWGPLRANDKNGRKRLYDFFKQHLDQLSFCSLD